MNDLPNRIGDGFGSDQLVVRLRALADDDRYCIDDWSQDICRQAADEIERLSAGLGKIVQGGYADGADVAHPAIRIARETLDPQWREKALQRAMSHYPTTSPNNKDEPTTAPAPNSHE